MDPSEGLFLGIARMLNTYIFSVAVVAATAADRRLKLMLLCQKSDEKTTYMHRINTINKKAQQIKTNMRARMPN